MPWRARGIARRSAPRQRWQRAIGAAALIAFVSADPRAAHAQSSVADQQGAQAVLELTVNGVNKGPVRAIVRGKSILLPVETLAKVGLGKVPGAEEKIGGVPYIDITAVAPLHARFDEANLALALNVEPSLLPATTTNLAYGAPPGTEYLAANSAFVNYAVTAATQETSPSFLTEQGWSMNGRLLDNSMDIDQNGRFSRLATSLSFDDRDALTRFTLGDATAQAGTLGGSAQIAGVSYATNYAINPYFTSYPNQRFAGTVSTPSVADIYVNGLLTRSIDLPPGPFNLQNIPAIAGAGNVRVVVRNAFGQTQELGGPYYLNTQTLRQGLSDFDYSVGLERETFATGIAPYSGPAFSAYHRYGLTDWATPGFFANGDNQRAAMGPEITLGSPYGTFAAFGAVSTEAGVTGDAGSVQYEYQANQISFGGAVTYTSPDYATLDLHRAADREVGRADLFGGVPVGSSSLTLDISDGHFRDAGRSRQASLTSSTPFGGRYQFTVTLSHAETQSLPTDNGVFFALMVTLGSDSSATASVNRDHDGTQAALQAQKSLPTGEGYGYLAQAAVGPQTQDVVDAQYQGDYGLYEVDGSRQAGHSTGSASVSGALVAIGGDVYATRPIQDAYALIRVPGVENVTGTVSHLDVGKTDADGDLLVPNLLSYYGNQIGINDHDVPIDYSVQSTERIVAPPYRGGAVVDFPVKRLQAFMGTAEILDHGKPTVPAYGEMTLIAGGEKVSSPIGAHGEIYFESVPPGSYPATIDYQGAACRFTVAIPKSAEREVQLGKLSCAP